MSFIVAIDGPAGAGKSTVARLAAERLDMALVDTGAIYRCVALRALRSGIGVTDAVELGELATNLKLEFPRGKVLCEGEDVTLAIRSPEVSSATSAVATQPPVRSALLELQRRLGREAANGAVLEGRDIGTVVFPDANVKVFLTANAEERARRRHEELRTRGVTTTYEAVLADQIGRDRQDENRETAPLKAAPDAVRLDTTGLDTETVVARILDIVRHRMKG